MRGRQLKVYLHRDDQTAVDEYLSEQLDAVLLKERSHSREDFYLSDSRQGGAGALICSRSMLDYLSLRHIDKRGEWIVNFQSSPVVEWWFSRVEDTAIYPGRFYYSSPSGLPSEVADKFLSMASLLFRWIRSSAVSKVEMEWGGEWVGPTVRRMLNDGSIRLRQNPPGSRL